MMKIRTFVAITACMLGSTLGLACAAPIAGPATGAGDKADNPHDHVADSFLHITDERAHFTALPASAQAVGYSPDHEGSAHDGVALMQMWIDEDEVAAMLPMGTPTVSLLVRMTPFTEGIDAAMYVEEYFGANFYFRDLRLIDIRLDEHTSVELRDAETIRAECAAGANAGLFDAERCDELFPNDGSKYVLVSGEVPDFDVFDRPGSTWAVELVDVDRENSPDLSVVAMRVSFDVKTRDAVLPTCDSTTFEQTFVDDFAGQFEANQIEQN